MILESGADFFVLRLRSSTQEAGERRKDFERFLSSFKLKPAR